MTFKADVYKLCCLDPEIKEIYVGSTRSFRQRKNSHKQSCNNPTNKDHNLYVYQFIRENGGFQNWSMISIFTGEFETKHEMHRKEREYMEELQSSLNKAIPTRTIQEWKIDNSDILKQYKNQYRIENSDKIKQYRIDNSELYKQKNTCECGGKYTHENKSQHFKTKKHKDFTTEIIQGENECSE
jgi:hypothetical protein